MRTQTREWCAPITDTDYFIHSIWTLKSVSSEFAIFIALDQTVHMHMKFMKLLQYYSNKSDSWDSWRRCRVISGNFRDVLLNSVGLSKFLFWGRGRCSKCIYDSIFDCEIRSNWFTSFKLSRCRIFMKLIVGSAWRKPTGISATARSNKKCLCFILRWFSIVTVTFFFLFSALFLPPPLSLVSILLEIARGDSFELVTIWIWKDCSSLRFWWIFVIWVLWYLINGVSMCWYIVRNFQNYLWFFRHSIVACSIYVGVIKGSWRYLRFSCILIILAWHEGF